VAEEHLGLDDVLAAFVVHGGLGSTEVVALYVFAVPLEEPLQEGSLRLGRVSAVARWEHQVVGPGPSVSLVRDDSVDHLLAEEYLSRSSLLGDEPDPSEALLVRLRIGELAELGPDDVLDAKGAVKEEHDHGERLLVVVAGCLQDPVKLDPWVGLVLAFTLPNN